MVEVNKNFDNLKKNYLFVEIERKVNEYVSKNPNADIIRLGIGDVTLPLCPVIIEAMHDAVDEMAKKETFKGYGPHEGYKFLREAIADYYKKYNVSISSDEIFVSDGAKSDVSGILDVFEPTGNVLIPDPAYPVYVDAAIMSGRNIVYINADKSNNFLPLPDYNIEASIIHLCSPNNPTGAVYSREQLKQWVDYAKKNKAVILFDAAYESFIEGENLPHSIFEIEGAKECAIEFCSFSKNAGFTGIRCGYAVVPKELKVNEQSARDLWARRQSTKFNGASYITQKAAFAALSNEGQKQINESVKYYKENTKVLSKAFSDLEIWNIGGINSPYLWIKCPNNMTSWEFFDYLLGKLNIVGTPGSGFGKNGEGFLRLSAFGSHESTAKAVERLKTIKF